MVDSTGRRHSVSIPLLPHSPGGGIGGGAGGGDTGGARLVTIQRKGSQHSQHGGGRRSSSRNMESITVRHAGG